MNAHPAVPRFSVATPTRNDLHKLKRCVGSVRGQQGVAVQHLVQDAQSGDGTAQWLAGQPGLAWVSEADGGMYDAIQRAWGRSSGEFLSWLNADEQYLPGTLAQVAEFFDQHPNRQVLFADYIVCSDSGAPVALRREIPFRSLYVRNSFLYAQSCTLFFRRSLLDQGWLNFDTQLRYAADKDLLLRLAARGVPMLHLPQYLALFGIDGSNLSSHDGMLREAEAVRQRHGAFDSALLRQTVLALRRVERLCRGAYARRSLNYAFATDEVPHYQEQHASHVGGRYALSDGVSCA